MGGQSGHLGLVRAAGEVDQEPLVVARRKPVHPRNRGERGGEVDAVSLLLLEQELVQEFLRAAQVAHVERVGAGIGQIIGDVSEAFPWRCGRLPETGRDLAQVPAHGARELQVAATLLIGELGRLLGGALHEDHVAGHQRIDELEAAMEVAGVQHRHVAPEPERRRIEGVGQLVVELDQQFHPNGFVTPPRTPAQQNRFRIADAVLGAEGGLPVLAVVVIVHVGLQVQRSVDVRGDAKDRQRRQHRRAAEGAFLKRVAVTRYAVQQGKLRQGVGHVLAQLWMQGDVDQVAAGGGAAARQHGRREQHHREQAAAVHDAPDRVAGRSAAQQQVEHACQGGQQGQDVPRRGLQDHRDDRRYEDGRDQQRPGVAEADEGPGQRGGEERRHQGEQIGHGAGSGTIRHRFEPQLVSGKRRDHDADQQPDPEYRGQQQGDCAQPPAQRAARQRAADVQHRQRDDHHQQQGERQRGLRVRPEQQWNPDAVGQRQQRLQMALVAQQVSSLHLAPPGPRRSW